ncbi:hypothetical protein EXIGLDRAFT_844488 [Exidia glandulosa HHB12029]|uniref:Protein kinase domain-containing protein n=1 Tax=Exidia glandulosa HHB12029 TaxID=1314781 RepID=A0A165C0E8_EXIGL|nr:hypothetical protein EXIGLDRAFT_844488 [Exidia glandulosa HHB12029]
MSARRPCFIFVPGSWIPFPIHALSSVESASTSTLTELAKRAFCKPSFVNLRAYQLPEGFDPATYDWSNWENPTRSLTALDLGRKPDDVDGSILFLELSKTTVTRSSAASSSSPASGAANPASPSRKWLKLSPSEAAKLPNFLERQLADDETTIYNGRPPQCTGPDVCCYSFAFYNLKAAVHGDKVVIDNYETNIEHAVNLMTAASSYYPTEADRLEELRGFLTPLCPQVSWRDTTVRDGSRSQLCPDAFSIVDAHKTLLKRDIYPCFGELKNEVGTGASDPAHQVACDYELFCRWEKTRIWRERCCVPTILVAMAGTDLVIYGAIHLGGPVVQELYRIKLQLLDQDRTAAAEHIVHVFASLSMAIATLRDFYQTLPFDPIPTFIQPTYKIPDRIVNWVGTPFPLQPRSNRMVFFADVESPTYTGPVVIKFPRTYSVDAHRKMEALRAAAPLVYYAFDDVLRRHVVVTQRLGEPGEVLEDELQHLRNALEEYHREGFVFGDLRSPNVVRDLDDQRRLKLIDFDWAGRQKEARYPAINAEIDWAAGVKSFAFILPEHDMAMLAKLPISAL